MDNVLRVADIGLYTSMQNPLTLSRASPRKNTIRIHVFQIVDIYRRKVMLPIVCVCSQGRWVCLVPGPFQGVGMPGFRYLLGWVCLVHLLEDTTPGGIPPESISQRRYTPTRYTPWHVTLPESTPPARYILQCWHLMVFKTKRKTELTHANFTEECICRWFYLQCF